MTRLTAIEILTWITRASVAFGLGVMLVLLVYGTIAIIKRIATRDPLPPFDFGARHSNYDGEE